MTKGYLITIPSLLVAATMLLFGMAMAAGEQSLADLIAQEESGIEAAPQPGINPVSKMPAGGGLITNTIPQDSVLLIPESSADKVGMYDPNDGTYLGDLIDGTGLFSTPIDAIQGPDDNIYVSDQVADAVFVFDTSGTYLSTYADASDGLDNVRGIAFRNDTLYVTTIHTYIARFAGPHNRISDVNTGIGSFDVCFLDDGRFLVSAHGSPNGIQLYDADGNLVSQLFNISFPEQTISDDLAPGNFLDAAFVGGDQITDFDADGTIQQTTLWNYGRGVYRLGNGNLLATSSYSTHSGVFEIQPGTGDTVETEMSGSGFRFIELFTLVTGPPPTGRCCYNNYQDCVDTSQAACTAIGGEWDGALNCNDDPCPVNPYGRCCYNDNVDCADTVEAACIALGGTWDAGLNCTDDPCPTGGGCDYVPGDVNGSDSYNGLDITYGVAFFKGGPDPLCNACALCPDWSYCGDVNGSCSYNGLDITYGVAYFKGGPGPIYCQDCPPNP